MPISPWYLGQLAPAWTIQLVPDTGYVNVTGLTTNSFSLRIRDLDKGTETTGQGTFSNIVAAVTTTVQPGNQIVVVSHASVQFQPVTADVNLGNYELWVDVTFSNGKQPFLIQQIWQVIQE
jgi:hypothetical protein